MWTGSLFDCPGDQIILRHTKFESGSASGECNSEAVIARNIRVLSSGSNDMQCYISQLILSNFTLSYDNQTVKCLYQGTSTENIIIVGETFVLITTGSYIYSYVVTVA